MELIPEKGYDAITVQDITDRAILNRTTFYMHYSDKDDLLQTMVNEVLDEFEQIYQHQQVISNDTAFISKIFTLIFEHVARNDEFYAVMLGEQSIAPFTQQMRQKIEEIALRWIPPDSWQDDTIEPTLFVSFISSGFLGVVRWWIHHNMPHTPELMARQMIRLTFAGIHQTVGLSLSDLPK